MLRLRSSRAARSFRVTAAALLLFAGACSAPAPDDPPAQPAGWADEVALPTAQDLNADPRILEVNLEARVADLEIVPGKLTRVWTYDGGLPGPLLRARAGDRLIVHFKNSLPEPTSIHWHGLRIPNDMDGVPDHPYPPVAPGGSFDYDFVLPDAGTFWYHPHYASAAQLGNGLYGALIVDDPNEAPGLGDEAVLVLSDIGIDDSGVMDRADAGGDFGVLFGREGNLVLVNGKRVPTLHVRPGVRQRWRVINAAKARYFQLMVPGTSFTRIGGDAGMIGDPERLDALVLTPAQRADVILEPKPGPETSSLPVTWVPYDRGFGTVYNRPSEDVMRLEFEGSSVTDLPPLPALHRDIPALDLAQATAVDLSLTMDTSTGRVVMGIDGVPAGEAGHLQARLGERQVWTVKNTFAFDHPFHLHGFFFQVLDVNGAAPAVREWRDTVNVPVDGTVRLGVAFDERPGHWMFHCHILDHADAGMMGMIHLE